MIFSFTSRVCQRFYHQLLRHPNAKTSGYEFVKHKSLRWVHTQPGFTNFLFFFIDGSRAQEMNSIHVSECLIRSPTAAVTPVLSSLPGRLPRDMILRRAMTAILKVRRPVQNDALTVRLGLRWERIAIAQSLSWS